VIPCTNCGQPITEKLTTNIGAFRWMHVKTLWTECMWTDLVARGYDPHEGYCACPEHYEDGSIVVAFKTPNDWPMKFVKGVVIAIAGVYKLFRR
jgi:hypothetical protein